MAWITAAFLEQTRRTPAITETTTAGWKRSIRIARTARVCRSPWATTIVQILPFYYALADAFTICDQHFCSSLTGTTPNRLHLWTGTIRDKPTADLGSERTQLRCGFWIHGETGRLFPSVWKQAGVSWRIYQNELSVASGLEGEEDAWLANFSDNPLEWFDQYNVGFRKTHLEYLERMASVLPKEIEKLRADGGSAKELKAKEELLQYVTRRACAMDRGSLAQAFGAGSESA